MPKFRISEDTPGDPRVHGTVVEAATAESAAFALLGLNLVRCGRRSDLRAVLVQLGDGDAPQAVVRLYRTAFDRRALVTTRAT